MRKLILSTLGIIAMSSSMSALAASNNTGFYMGASIGAGDQMISGYKLAAPTSDNEDFSLNNLTLNDKNSTIFSGNINFGYDFYSQFQTPVRVELAFNKYGNDKYTESKSLTVPGAPDSLTVGNENSISLYNIMLNTYYDWHNSTPLTPYIMGGIGFAHVSNSGAFILSTPADADGNGYTERDSVSGTDNNFAYTFGAGLDYQITDNLSGDVSLRYLSDGKIKTKSSDSDLALSQNQKLASIDALIGIRYEF